MHGHAHRWPRVDEDSRPARRLLVAGVLLLGALLVVAGTAQAAAVETMDARFGEGLFDAGAAWTGEHAFVFGGNDGELDDMETDKIWRYHPGTDEVVEMDATLPTARDQVAAVWTGQGAYLFGGTGCETENPGELGNCEEVFYYEPGAAQVETVTTLPRGDVVQAVWTGDEAYLFSARTTDIYRFDPGTETVTTLDTAQDAARGDGSAVWTGQAALVFGGSEDRTILRYDPGTETASTMDATLPSARNLTAAVWTGEHAFVFGGQGQGQDLFDEVLRYDPGTDTLTTLDASFSTGRGSFPGVWTGSYAFLFGGTEDDGYTDRIFRFTPDNAPPQASFTVTVDERTVTVDASPSEDPDGQIEAYRWDWGDGDTSTGGPTNEHTYDSAGERTITLTVEDDVGATGTEEMTVSVDNQLPTAEFEVDVESSTVYADASNASDPDGEIVSYEWRWGDGNSSTGQTASHEYATPEGYTIELTVIDDDGGSATERTEVYTSNQAPTAVLEVTTDGRRVTADASGSHDPDDALTDFRWDWGDGDTSQGEVSKHTYDESGTYTVTLDVYDGHGAQDTAQASITVENAPPSTNVTLVGTNLTVEADATNATDVDGSIDAVLWQWGDLSENRGVKAEHTYAEHGVYTVAIRLTDDDGARAWTNRTVDLRNQAPNATMTLDVNGQAVRTDASNSTDVDGRIVDHTWRWGDGDTTDSGHSRRHWYRAPGVYDVELTVTDDDGDSTTITRTVEVGDPDTASQDGSEDDGDGAEEGDEASGDEDEGELEPVGFVIEKRQRRVTVYAGEPVTVDGNEPVLRWRWGDRSGGATGDTAAHYYHRDGRYTITLTVDYLDGRKLVTERNVTIGDVPPPATNGTENGTGARADASGATSASLTPSDTEGPPAADESVDGASSGSNGSAGPHDAPGIQRGVPAPALAGVVVSLLLAHLARRPRRGAG